MSDDEASQEAPKYMIHYDGDEESLQYCEKNGKAKVTYENGDSFEGDIKDLKKNGKGTYAWKELNNACFEGEWIEDVMSTAGRFVFPDGSIYEGGIDKGQRHGQGKITYANGDTYEGGWAYGKREGAEGVYTFHGSGASLIGEWKDDQWRGSQWTFPDGTVFFGHFDPVTNQPIGEGKFVFGNGHEMVGMYTNKGHWVPKSTVYTQEQ